MFQLTTVLLPSIDDILKFFTEMRNNPVDSAVFLFSKALDLLYRFVMKCLVIPKAMLKF